jgi:hypothetical protein
MNQNIWGPHLWFSLHTISFDYPITPDDNDKKNYKNFFTSLENVIPCSVCKKNYIRHLKEHPINNYLSTKEKLVHWVIDIHNMVNAEIGKKILSYETVIKKYESVYKKKIKFKKSKTKEDDSEDNDICNEKNDICNEKNEKNIKNMTYTNIIYGFFTLFIILLIINLFYVIMRK